MPARTPGVTVVFFVLCVSLFALQSGCSTSGDGGTQTSASNSNALHLALSSPSGFTAVVADGRSTIPLRMQVTNGAGAGMSGLPVTFAFADSSTTTGVLSPSPVVRTSHDLLSADQADQTVTTRADSTESVTVITDANGIAQVLLTASTIAGIAVITADVQGFRANIFIAFVPGPPAHVLLTASPTTVSPGGDATLTATVIDANGNVVPGGTCDTFCNPVTVMFSLSTNTSGAILSAVSGVTDSSGQVTVQYTAGGVPGTDTVRAQVTSTVVGFAAITVTESQNLSQVTGIEIEAAADSVVADGVSTVAIRATVTTAPGFSPAGLLVTFTTTVGRLSSTTARTNANGVATVNLIATTSLGTATVTATIAGFSDSTTVRFVAGLPAVVLLSAFPATINIGQTAQVTATVRDANNNPAANQTLTFSQPTRGTLSATTGVTNTNGQLTVTYTGTALGTETLQARTVNGITGSVSVLIVAAPVTGITITAAPDTLVADGVSTAVIRATVSVASGPRDGLVVAFKTTAGTLSASTATTDINGIAIVNLTAPTSLGTATVIAAIAGVSASTTVRFVAGAPAEVLLSAFPVTINAGGKAEITATVRDANKNPASNQTLIFLQPTRGTLSATTGVTDANGRLPVTYTDTGTGPGSVTLQARTTNGIISNMVTVLIISVHVTGITIEAAPDRIVADGVSTATIRATVSVASGPLDGLVVAFKTTAGTLSASTATTDINGTASVTLTSTTSLGTATVTAAITGVSASKTVTFVAGLPTEVLLSAFPVTINAGGKAEITATVRDANKNPASNQTLIFLQPTRGTLSATTGVTDANGRLPVTYTDTGTGPGSATIQARTTNAITGSVTLKIVSVLVTGIKVTAAPPTVIADGSSTVTISATVTVASGSPAGLDVAFKTTAGTLSASTATTDINGIAIVQLTSTTSLGTATVTAAVASVSASTTVTFVAGPPATVTLTATPSTVNGGGTSMIQATVLDAHGNPVEGQTLVFAFTTNTSGASLDKLQGDTDDNGRVTVTYTAGTTAGTDTVRARTTNGIIGSVSITVTGPPASVTLSANPATVVPGGLSTIQATVKDAAGNPTAGQTVVFTFITNETGACFTDGTATCLMPPGSASGVTSTNGLVAVTYEAGSTSSSVPDPRTDTVQASTTNGITATVSITVTAMKSSMPAMASSSSTTGPADTVPDLLTTGGDPGSRTMTVTASGATATATLAVSLDNFAITTPAPATEVPFNTPQTVTGHWDVAGVPQVGQTMNFFATRGDFAATPSCPATLTTISTTTDSNGNATVYICADNAGPAVISAVANVSHGPASQVEIEFVATTVNALVLQATPTTIGINPPGSTTQQSVITAVARDAQGNLVKNQTVSFALQDVSGGDIFPASDITDSFGQASTVYTAGAAPSTHDGVMITAALGAVTATATLTVTQRPHSVVLGTGNVVNAPTSTQYALPYSVLVTDADGNPIAGASVDLSVLPIHYQKGFYDTFSDVHHNCSWQKVLTSPTCENEDRDQNGSLDPGEDFNSNGRLDPGNVATASPSTVTTDTSGLAFFDVVYAKQFTWVEVTLQARTIVAGTEGASQAQFFLLGAASDFNDCTVAPPGQISPFGVATSCADPL